MWASSKIGNHGFTLIEAMLALSVLAVIAALFPLWIRLLDDPKSIDFDHRRDKVGVYDPMEVELFFQEAGAEIRATNRLKTSNNGKKLTLEKDYTKKSVQFDFYNHNQVRRQAENKGHEVMVYDIKECEFKVLKSGNGVKITITAPGQKGNTYERIFLSMAPTQK